MTLVTLHQIQNLLLVLSNGFRQLSNVSFFNKYHIFLLCIVAMLQCNSAYEFQVLTVSPKAPRLPYVL